MSLAPVERMSIEDFLSWVSGQDDGRFELIDGFVIAMAPERAEHMRGKQDAYIALRSAIAQSRVPCEAFADGLAVKIDNHNSLIPDALVNCGERIAGGQQVAPNPIIVVEVLSPSTQHIDKARKLLDYFRVPGLVHYVIIDMAKKAVIHHRRKGEDSIDTMLVRKGQLSFDPPGISISIEDILG
jgi:Uma2 family endonuclease